MHDNVTALARATRSGILIQNDQWRGLSLDSIVVLGQGFIQVFMLEGGNVFGIVSILCM